MMTTVQTIAAAIALLGFAALLVVSNKLKIRPWIIVAAGLGGVVLAWLIGVLAARVTSLAALAAGVLLVCVGGALVALAISLIARSRSGRVFAGDIGHPRLAMGKPGVAGRSNGLAEAQGREEALLSVAPAMIRAEPLGESPKELPAPALHQLPEESAVTAGLPEMLAETPAPAPAEAEAPPAGESKPEAAHEADAIAEPLGIVPAGIQAVAPAKVPADAETQPAETDADGRESPAGPAAAPRSDGESDIDRMDRLFREEQERIAIEQEQQAKERERIAREEEERRAEQHRALEEEVRLRERERAEKDEERRRRERERKNRREEERRLKQEKEQDAAAGEEQRIRERIQAERRRVAEEEQRRLQEDQAAAEQAAVNAAAMAAVVELPGADAEEWRNEQERLARELAARRQEQRKAAEEEKRWLEEQERLARELDERRRLEADELALRQEQEARERAEAERLEAERLEAERIEAERAEAERIRQQELEARVAEAAGHIDRGERLLAEGRFIEALPWLERAARMDVPEGLRARAGVAAVEALAALGWKADAMKKVQAMRELALAPADRKRLEGLLKKVF